MPGVTHNPALATAFWVLVAVLGVVNRGHISRPALPMRMA
jgi:hypothetical protein